MLFMQLLEVLGLPVNAVRLEKSWLNYTVLRHELKK